VPEKAVVAADATNEVENKEPAAGQRLLMPAAKAADKTTLRWAVPMALPNFKEQDARKTAEERDPLDDLLPKPELDFSKIPSAVYADENDPRSIYKQKRIGVGKIRLIALVLALSAVVGFAGYVRAWNLIPAWKDAAVEAEQWASNAVMRRGNTRASIRSPNGSSNGDHVGDETSPASTGKPMAAASAVDGDGPSRTDDGSSAGSAEVMDPIQPELRVRKKTASARDKPLSRRPRSAVAAVAEEKPAPVVASDAPIIAAKLAHAATPVYPPDAMLNYITGDVKAELVVEANGKVGEVKVISGPKALRDAAVEALKKYEYQPATQDGRAVVSKTMATVKFWFNP